MTAQPETNGEMERDREVAHLLIDFVPADSRLPDVMEKFDAPFSVIRVEGVSEPELHIGNKVLWGLDEIEEFVQSQAG
jgi:hypothetical protein